jgi:hypothetical protein
MLSNLLTSANVVMDVLLGSLATLLAGLCTAALGRAYREKGDSSLKKQALACLMPVVFNGPFVGVIWAATAPLADSFWLSALLAGLYVAAGEAAVLLILGLPAMRFLPRIVAVRSLADTR